MSKPKLDPLKKWRIMNRRRGELIDKTIEGSITKDERAELDGLQAYANRELDRMAPTLFDEVEKLERLLGIKNE